MASDIFRDSVTVTLQKIGHLVFMYRKMRYLSDWHIKCNLQLLAIRNFKMRDLDFACYKGYHGLNKWPIRRTVFHFMVRMYAVPNNIYSKYSRMSAHKSGINCEN